MGSSGFIMLVILWYMFRARPKLLDGIFDHAASVSAPLRPGSKLLKRMVDAVEAAFPEECAVSSFLFENRFLRFCSGVFFLQICIFRLSGFV